MQQTAYGFEPLKNPLIVWCIGQFVGEVLSGPMLIMFAVAPQPACCYVVYDALVSNPNFVAVLSVPQSQLGTGIGWKRMYFCRHKELEWRIFDLQNKAIP